MTSMEASAWAAARGEKWKAGLAGMEATLRPVDEPLIRALQLNAPYRIADLACGGGGTTFEVVRNAPAGSVVHGFDISSALVEVARSRQIGGERTAFECINLQSAPPPHGPYDRLVSRFGVMFFDDPETAFTNLREWLVPGGRFAFAVWNALTENPWQGCVREVVGRVVEVPRGAADQPGPFRYQDAAALIALLERSGFTGLHSEEWRGTFAIGGNLAPPEAAQFALSSFSSFDALLAQAGAGAYERAAAMLEARFAEYEENDVVQLGASAHIVSGSRPI